MSFVKYYLPETINAESNFMNPVLCDLVSLLEFNILVQDKNQVQFLKCSTLGSFPIKSKYMTTLTNKEQIVSKFVFKLIREPSVLQLNICI